MGPTILGTSGLDDQNPDCHFYMDTRILWYVRGQDMNLVQ